MAKRRQKDLARGLGISQSMVSRLAKQGMPVTSIAAAKRWRDRNINPALSKESRGWANRPDQLPNDNGDEKFSEMLPSTDTSALSLVTLLAAKAETDFSRWETELRAAMRLVPVTLRDRVAMPLSVWNALLAEFERLIAAHEAADPELVAHRLEQAAHGEKLTAEDAEYMGNIWYGVAMGAIRAAPIPGGQSND